MGVAVDGSEKSWEAVAEAELTEPAPLPAFSPYQTAPAQYLEVFRRGSEAFEYQIDVEPEVEWLSLSQREGALDEALPQERVELRVNDWSAVPEGGTTLTLTVRNRADDTSVRIEAPIEKPAATPEPGTFVESNGYISIEASHELARIINSDDVSWQLIPNIGRTGSGLTPLPVTAERQTPGEQDGPRLEYDLHLYSSGSVTVWLYLSPRQNTYPTDGLKIAAALDGGEPQVFNITTELDTAAFPLYKHGWQLGVADNVHRVPFDFNVDQPGKHVLEVWMVDPSVVVQKIVVDTGGLRDSYLGPPPSYTTPSD